MLQADFRSSRSLWCWLAMSLTLLDISLVLIGCGGSEASPPRSNMPGVSAAGTSGAAADSGGAGAPSTPPKAGGPAAMAGGGQKAPVMPPSGGGKPAPSADDDAGMPNCGTAQAQAKLVKQPVDVIMILDNSGSMDDELRSVEANINQGFASILQQSGVDYRVILISRHRRRDRDDTSVCVTAPLSGLAQCPADRPVFSDRFFHYSVEVGSRDSFDILLDTYAPPFNRRNEEEFGKAPNGWSAWLRPGAKKVFLEISDDDENADVASFILAMTELSPENFGMPSQVSFVWHSIVGIAEKAQATSPYLANEPVERDECDDVKNAGESYQELSRLTGGLRFPICQFQAYGTVFRVIAEDVAKSGDIACEFDVPAPPAGQTLDLDKVAVSYQPGAGGAAQTFTQAANVDACKGSGAFYAADKRIHLCPDTCTSVRSDGAAKLDVLFTCENTITLK